MKLLKLIETKSNPTGTYAAVKFNRRTTKLIAEYIAKNKIPNPVHEDKLHCTLLYSKKHCPKYNPIGEKASKWKATPKEFDVFGTDTRCLVLVLSSGDLVDRHNHLMKKHNATFDYPTYTPHVTLSYDIGDLDIESLPNIKDTISELVVSEEYGTDLDEDWSDDADKPIKEGFCTKTKEEARTIATGQMAFFQQNDVKNNLK